MTEVLEAKEFDKIEKSNENSNCPNKLWKKCALAAQKMKFSFKGFFSKCDQIRSPADLVIFTEEIVMEKFILCAVTDAHESL